MGVAKRLRRGLILWVGLAGLAVGAAGQAPAGQAPTAPAAAPATAANLAGTWRCQVDYNGNSLAVVLYLSQGEDGKLVASLDNVIDPSAGPMAAAAALKDGTLHLDVGDIQGSYDGTVNPAGDAIDGAWTVGGGNIGCALKKDPKGD